MGTTTYKQTQGAKAVIKLSLRKLWETFEAVTFFNQVMDLFFKLLIFFVLLALSAKLPPI
jgi:hypothetical protein